MRPMFFVGIVLIALGIASFSYQGVLWIRGQEQVAKIGPIEVNRERAYAVPLAPILGGLAIAGGIALTVMGARKTV